MPAYTLDALRQDVADGTIDTVLVAFPDMQGRLIGKRFQAEFFLEGGLEETHACDYLLADDLEMEPVPGYAAANWEKGYGDFVLRPDPETLLRAAWLEGTAIVLCDVEDHHGEPVPHSPRAVLRRQLARLEERGLTANLASELEFYLFHDTFRQAWEKGYRQLVTAGYYVEDYHIFQTTKEEGVMRAVRRQLQASGIPVENSKGEWGPGQEEINVRYAEGLAMADRHVVMKNAIKEIAHAQGKAVTFMAKWHERLAGSSGHVHLSLARGGRNVFHDPEAEDRMSNTLRRFLAGQLEHAREITWFLAPYVNSYKRFLAGTFAPTRAVWSRDNRTAGFRLCGGGTEGVRIECRIGGADLNPYLAFAALIAAGLSGVERELALEEPFSGDAYHGAELREIPKTLREATEEMRGSAMLREALGAEVLEHYLHAAEWEQREHDRSVTDWELRRGFERS
jgi:glutamine synthetase